MVEYTTKSSFFVEKKQLSFKYIKFQKKMININKKTKK